MPIDSRDSFERQASVVVIIPCLNEEDYIAKTIARFSAESSAIVGKIVVADGGSTDQTLRIVHAYADHDERIVVLKNDRRIQSSGFNKAVELYGDLAPFVVRADAHADYPSDFCAKLLEAQEMTGADSVVVSMIAEGVTCFQTAAAAAQNSKLGNGGAAHRRAAEGRFVDHGHHALISVSAFRSAGGYDEAFSHNEDAELDLRLISAGHRIYLCAGADISYFPRKSPVSLFYQYRNFGRGRAMTILKHHARPKLRQVVPIMIGPVVAISLLYPVASFLALPALVWAVASLAYGVALGVRDRSGCVCGSGFAAMLMHLGFSVGFIWQIAKQIRFGGSRQKFGPQMGAH